MEWINYARGDRFHDNQGSTLLSVLERCLPPTSDHWSPRTSTNIEATLPQCLLCKEASDRRQAQVFPALDGQTTQVNEVLTKEDQAPLPHNGRAVCREDWNTGKNANYPLEDQASALPHNGRAVCREDWNTGKNEDYPTEDQASALPHSGRAVCREDWNTGKNENYPTEDQASALPHNGRAVCREDWNTGRNEDYPTEGQASTLPHSGRAVCREDWNTGKNEDYPVEDLASALPYNGRAVCREDWNTGKNEDYPVEDQASALPHNGRAVCRDDWNTVKNEDYPTEDQASALPHSGRAVCKTEWALGKEEVHQLRVGKDTCHGVRGSSRWYTDAALPITNPQRPLRITLSTGLPSPASLMPRPHTSQVDHMFSCLALDMCSQKSKSHGSGLGEAKKYGLPLPAEAMNEMVLRPNYSKKVFIGGLPPDIDCDEIGASFARFGALQVGWPHKNESRSVNPPKGFAFLQFDSAESVHMLVKHCQLTDNGGYFILVSSNAMKDKAVQVRPWIKDDADYMIDENKIVDRNTVFVGGVPRPLTACQLAQVMSAMFGPVCYAGVDIDPDLGYPKGAGRVIFSCQASCIAAISSRFVKLNVGDMKKSIEVKAFVLQDQDCDGCKGHLCVNKPAAFFCSNVGCLKYYCALCWAKVHEQPGKQYHKPTHQKTTSSIF